jgi:hypothetical protein
MLKQNEIVEANRRRIIQAKVFILYIHVDIRSLFNVNIVI